MADEPQGTDGQDQPQNSRPPSNHPPSNHPPSNPPQDIHYQPTAAWHGPQPPQTPPQTPPPPQGMQPPPQPPQAPAPPPHGMQPPPPSAYPQHPGPYGYPPQGGQPLWGGPAPQPGPQPPGFGYPPQPGYPMAPVVAPSRGVSGGVFAGVIGGVVALALIAGAIVLFASGGDEDDGKPTADAVQLATRKFAFAPHRAVLWKAKSEAAAMSESTALVGQWLGAGNLVVGDQKSLISYDLKTGSQGWTM